MNSHNNMLLGDALPKALLVGLKTIVYFIILPYKIWKASVIRLGESVDKPIIDDDEEFPIYTFNKVSMDTTIMILPAIGIIIGILSWINAPYYQSGFGVFLFSIFTSYFMIPLFSFFKEVITISLSNINKLDKIAKNTSKD